MTVPISAIGISSSLILPWVFGCAVTLWLLRNTRDISPFIIAGHGYTLGIMLTALTVKCWGTLGLDLHYWGIFSLITALTIAIFLRLRSCDIQWQSSNRRGHRRHSWKDLVIIALLALLFFRYLNMGWELILRPLYPWDAWMNWAPKAIVWFHYSDLVPFVDLNQWLYQIETQDNYTLRAWRYPEGIPLIQLWGMLAGGTADHPLIYLPWLFVPLSLGAALYGHLRMAGVSALVSTIAIYCLLSIPYFNVHTVLAGYADIWLASTTGMAVFALSEWDRTRQPGYGYLAILMALACTQLKIPGIIIGAIIVLILGTTFLRTKRWIILSVLAGGGLLVATTFLLGIDIDIPGIGRLIVDGSFIQVPYIGTFRLAYQSTHYAFFDNIFILLNWSMIWYIFILIMFMKICRGKLTQRPSVELILIASVGLFVAFIFSYTQIAVGAKNYTGLNRALLYLIPPMVFYIFRSFSSQPDHVGTTPGPTERLSADAGISRT